MKLAKLTFSLLLAFLMAGAALAQAPQDGKGRQGRGGRGGFFGGNPVAQFDRLFTTIKTANLGLSDDQTAKIEGVKSKYAPEVKKLGEESDAVLTDAQKATLKDLQAKAQAGDRSVYRNMASALNLTEDQTKKRTEIGTKARELQTKVLDEVKGILTDDQNTKLKAAMPQRGGGRNRGGKTPQKA